MQPTTAAKTVNKQWADGRANNARVWESERGIFRDYTVGCGHNLCYL